LLKLNFVAQCHLDDLADHGCTEAVFVFGHVC
jgi:hypothetical protein